MFLKCYLIRSNFPISNITPEHLRGRPGVKRSEYIHLYQHLKLGHRTTTATGLLVLTVRLVALKFLKVALTGVIKSLRFPHFTVVWSL